MRLPSLVGRPADALVPGEEPASPAERRRSLLEALRADRSAIESIGLLLDLAARTFGFEVAMYSVIDTERHRILASCGIDLQELPRETSLCARVVDGDAMLVIEDALVDPRAAGSALLAGPELLRFYAGVPVRARLDPDEEPIPIGTICLVDPAARRFGLAERELLAGLGRLAEGLIAARVSAVHAARLAEEKRAALDAARREQRLFRKAETIARIGSWRLELPEGPLHWSDQVFAIHGVPHGPAPTIERAIEFYAPSERARVAAHVRHAMRTGEPFDFVSELVRADGTSRRVRAMGELERRDGVPTALIGVFQDVTDEHAAAEALRRAAATDDLTQLPNRAECNRVLDAAIRRARSRDEPLALLLIDLDGFKSVNDRCGHQAGDELLQRVGHRLRAPYLSKTFAARLGGDEFVVLVTAPEDTAQLDALVARLLLDLRQAVPAPDGIAEVSGTIGVAWLEPGVTDRGMLLRRADQALYAAKDRRRGTHSIFGAAAAAPPPEAAAGR